MTLYDACAIIVGWHNRGILEINHSLLDVQEFGEEFHNACNVLEEFIKDKGDRK